MRPAKPLWGFGWAGWCLLPVAIALGWVYFTGHDLRFQLLWAINESLGWRGLSWFVTVPLVGHHFSLQEPGFGPIAIGSVLIAMQVHPARFRWWWYMALAACALLAPAFPWIAISSPALRSWLATGPPGASALWRPHLLADLVIAGVLWGIVRNPRFALVTTALILGSAAFQWWTMQRSAAGAWSGWDAWLARYAAAPAWHASLAATLLVWAITARRRTPPPWECIACGYDLRGSAGPLCPECGAAPPAAGPPVPSTLAP